MTLGSYENFPQTKIQRVDTFNSTLSSKQLQQKLIDVLYQANQREFSFEEIANPTVPACKVIFEFGLAEAGSFSYIDEEELKKAQDFLAKTRLQSMDFFCSIRYYKGNGEKQKPLRFDYYMLRTNFSKDMLEIQVYHERGPRYISPEDLTMFFFTKINETSKRAILKKVNI